MTDTTRVQFELPDEDFETLNAVKKKLGAISYAEASRRSFRLMHYILNCHSVGAEVIIRQDGKDKSLLLF